MTAKEKILEYLDFKGKNANQFYKETGLSVGFLKSGKHIGSNNIKIIINTYPDLSLDWLVMDKGEMIIKEKKKEINKNDDSLLLSLITNKDTELRKMAEEIGALKEQNRMLKKQIGYTSLPIASEK